jgi:hypothetical protein
MQLPEVVTVVAMPSGIFQKHHDIPWSGSYPMDFLVRADQQRRGRASNAFQSSFLISARRQIKRKQFRGLSAVLALLARAPEQ